MEFLLKQLLILEAECCQIKFGKKADTNFNIYGKVNCLAINVELFHL